MRFWLYVLILIVGGVATALLFPKLNWFEANSAVNDKDVEMVKTLTDRGAPFDDFADLFGDVAETKGGVYAFNLMKTASLPFGLDQHLLGHVVGDILYEQEGIDGMGLCTHDFRNACSHTMVIGALIDFGEGALPQIREACFNAPGGKGAYTMCFHGLGHGVLAYNGYDMEDTVAMCGRFGTEEYNDREAIECFGGAIMEIIGGGGHDQETWAEKRKEYLKPADPFGICKSNIVPDSWRPMCYNYMTPFAFEAFGADMAYPDPEIYKKTFALCDKIPASQKAERQSCFGGLGKEFIGIAIGRNFTPDYEPNEEQLGLMYNWCTRAEVQDGLNYCINSTMDSLYWGGERPYETALSYCGLVANTESRDDCFGKLIWNVSFYIDDVNYRQSFCDAIPSMYQNSCREQLLD